MLIVANVMLFCNKCFIVAKHLKHGGRVYINRCLRLSNEPADCFFYMIKGNILLVGGHGPLCVYTMTSFPAVMSVNQKKTLGRKGAFSDIRRFSEDEVLVKHFDVNRFEH